MDRDMAILFPEDMSENEDDRQYFEAMLMGNEVDPVTAEHFDQDCWTENFCKKKSEEDEESVENEESEESVENEENEENEESKEEQEEQEELWFTEEDEKDLKNLVDEENGKPAMDLSKWPRTMSSFFMHLMDEMETGTDKVRMRLQQVVHLVKKNIMPKSTIISSLKWILTAKTWANWEKKENMLPIIIRFARMLLQNEEYARIQLKRTTGNYNNLFAIVTILCWASQINPERHGLIEYDKAALRYIVGLMDEATLKETFRWKAMKNEDRNSFSSTNSPKKLYDVVIAIGNASKSLSIKVTTVLNSRFSRPVFNRIAQGDFKEKHQKKVIRIMEHMNAIQKTYLSLLPTAHPSFMPLILEKVLSFDGDKSNLRELMQTWNETNPRVIVALHAVCKRLEINSSDYVCPEKMASSGNLNEFKLILENSGAAVFNLLDIIKITTKTITIDAQTALTLLNTSTDLSHVTVNIGKRKRKEKIVDRVEREEIEEQAF